MLAIFGVPVDICNDFECDVKNISWLSSASRLTSSVSSPRHSLSACDGMFDVTENN